MKTKQTAVQWLQDKLFELKIKIDASIAEETFFLFAQAKQMEKEQIIDAYISGYSAPENLGDSKQYYNKTYGKE